MGGGGAQGWHWWVALGCPHGHPWGGPRGVGRVWQGVAVTLPGGGVAGQALHPGRVGQRGAAAPGGPAAPHRHLHPPQVPGERPVRGGAACEGAGPGRGLKRRPLHWGWREPGGGVVYRREGAGHMRGAGLRGRRRHCGWRGRGLRAEGGESGQGLSGFFSGAGGWPGDWWAGPGLKAGLEILGEGLWGGAGGGACVGMGLGSQGGAGRGGVGGRGLDWSLRPQGDQQAGDRGAGTESVRPGDQTGAGVHRVLLRWGAGPPHGPTVPSRPPPRGPQTPPHGDPLPLTGTH